MWGPLPAWGWRSAHLAALAQALCKQAGQPASATPAAAERAELHTTARELLYYFIFIIFLMKAEALEKDGEAFA